MLFKDSFYTVSSSSETENGNSFDIKIDPAHPIFSGHFPGNPVTPGVVQLEIIKELTGEATGKTCKLTEMANCKFLKVLNPQEDSEVTIELRITEEDDSAKVNAIIQNENGIFLKSSATYLLQ